MNPPVRVTILDLVGCTGGIPGNQFAMNVASANIPGTQGISMPREAAPTPIDASLGLVAVAADRAGYHVIHQKVP